jgi:hypothetical protein
MAKCVLLTRYSGFLKFIEEKYAVFVYAMKLYPSYNN